MEYTYFYSLDFYNSYRKYIKIIDYITESFRSVYSRKEAYLEDYEDSSKSIMNETNTDNIFGSFRLCLSKKKIFLSENMLFGLNFSER